MAQAKKTTTKKITHKCNVCKKEKIVDEFVRSKSTLLDKDGYVPICKKCLCERYTSLLDLYKKDKIYALIHLCLNMDFPFVLSSAEKLIDLDDVPTSLDLYFEIVSKQKKDNLTSLNEESIDDIAQFQKDVGIDSLGVIDALKDFKVTAEMYQRWGLDKKKKDIFYLENKYNEFIEAYGGTSPVELDIYRKYAIIDLRQKEALESGDDKTYINYVKSQSNLISDANLQPRDKTEDKNSMLLGVMIKNIEEYRPASVPREEFKDADKIGEYIKEHFIKPVNRNLGLE